MINEGVVHGTTSLPSRLDVAMWVHAAMLEMKGKGEIIRNAWKRHGFEWFVSNAGEQNVGGNEGEQDVGGNEDGLEQNL